MGRCPMDCVRWGRVRPRVDGADESAVGKLRGLILIHVGLSFRGRWQVDGGVYWSGRREERKVPAVNIGAE